MKIENGTRYRCVRDEINDRIYRFELVQEPSTEELLKRIEQAEETLGRVTLQLSKMIAEKAVKDSATKQTVASRLARGCVDTTSAKFKAIADHANAINDLIQNAPKA